MKFGRNECLAHDCTRAAHWKREPTPVAMPARWRFRWAGDWCGDHQAALNRGWTRYALTEPIKVSPQIPAPPPRPQQGRQR